MRTTLLILAAGFLSAAEGATSSTSSNTSIGIWNNQLLVTAPATGDHPLPGGTQRITVDWRDVTLDEAATFLRSATLLNIIVMPGCGERKLTLTVTSMPLASLVRWMGTQTGLSWAYSQEALVFSDKPLEGASVTRLYDVSSLAAQVRDFPGPELAFSSAGDSKGMSCFPIPDNANTAQNTEDIAEFLRRQLHIQ